ncbi:MAG: hypothetical protein KC620_15480, partial [Myxococcales bacterium]|nr:hypothetical protein [Myxococcales bacterium]
MSEPAMFDPSVLVDLPDQGWRRLGISQTFDRLLVEAAAVAPGPPDTVRDHAGRTLSGGAAKFWNLSFPQIRRELTRKRVLADVGPALALHPEFVERLERLIEDQHAGVSRVEPTPGVTLEDVLAHAKEREEREKSRSSRKRPNATPKARP